MKRPLLLCTFCLLVSCTIQSQTNWNKYFLNPVMVPGLPGTYSELGYPFAFVMSQGDTMHMWYTASDLNHNRIGYAWATDGINFEFSTEPLFGPSGIPGTFDKEGVFGASVLHINEEWYMWYNGNNTQPYFNGNLEVGLATSEDGINWTRYSSQPVLPIGSSGSWDSEWAYCNTVLFDEGIFKMWYTGDDINQQNVGYATSTDGISWTKYAGNPVLVPTFSSFLHNARVVKYNGMYHMWFNAFTGSKERLYYTTSSDGMNWSADYIEAMPLGEPGSFDADWVWHPSILIDSDGLFKMWYTGSDGSIYSIGYATDSTMVPTRKISSSDSPVTLLPNPASDKAELTFNLNTPTVASLSMIDAKGITVLNYSLGNLLPGRHSRVVDVSRILSGTYTIVLITNSGRASARLVIIR